MTNVQTGVENRLFSPVFDVTKALAMNISFLRVVPLRSVKTDAEHAVRPQPEVKTANG